VEVDLLDGSTGDDPVLDVAMAHALLDLVASGQRPPVVRCYRPRATVAFGRRDRLLAGFPDAVAAAGRHGFAPVIRGAGGRAAAYHEGCLIFDEVMPAGESTSGIRERFAEDARRQAAALRGLGVDARVGEVPGEYCPGEFSVNARGRVKLIGAAERIIRGAWLHSSVVVVDSVAAIRDVLVDVYAALGLDWDPDTAGGVAEEVPDVRLDDVRRALLEGYAARYELSAASLGEPERARVGALLDRHRVDPDALLDRHRVDP
jgi:octanoyl-[GcvH]:protein N-octanoyltransferase